MRRSRVGSTGPPQLLLAPPQWGQNLLQIAWQEDPGPQQPAAPGIGKLSARERELVTLVAQGHTNAQIAARLHISIRTVSSNLDRIRDKTAARRRADLTRLALTAGLI